MAVSDWMTDLEQLLEVGMFRIEVEPLFPPLSDGAAMEDDNIEVGVEEQDAVC